MTVHQFLQSGHFNVRLSLEAPTESEDGCGGVSETWIPQFDVWAKLIPIKGILVAEADSNRTEHTHWIYIRQRPGVEPGMRFVSGSRTFLIDVVTDHDESGRYFLCEVRETE
ncbi:MAG: phage head closure protein [Salaquimonas sp.]